MDILAKLFGSAARVKIARLFILNSDLAITGKETAIRTKVSPAVVRRELNSLAASQLLSKNRKNLWRLNPNFPFVKHLSSLFKADSVNRQTEITARFAGCGRIKFLLLAGLFIGDEDSRADLVLVGDRLLRGAIERAIKLLESDIGRELRYAVFTTEDFIYRVNTYDKFAREVLDLPHERVIDKLGLP